MISQCHKVMLSGGPVQIRRGPFYYNYGLAPLCMSKDMTKDKGRRYIYKFSTSCLLGHNILGH